MKSQVAATCFVLGTLLAPMTAYAADSDADRANPATFVKDSAITTKIKAKLAADHPTSAVRIKVDTDKNGEVWMTGTANSQSDIDNAVAAARNTDGVKTVHNNLTVQPDK